MVQVHLDTMARAKMSNPLDMLETSCTRLVRRMVNLPRAITRAVDQGLDLMTAGGGDRNHHYHHYPPLDQPIPNSPNPNWDFLAVFEQRFGHMHPFFYACRFVEVLKMAQDEHKLVFLYLHSLDHPFTPCFCKDTLCSEVVVQFLDANFMSWGGLADRGEGLHLATMVRPTAFPFCAIVARGSDDSLVVIQKKEGPMRPEELVEMLQTTLEDQGSAFSNGREIDEEKRRDDIRLRREQDAAYSASLQADQEKVLRLERKHQHQHKHQDNVVPNAQDIQILIRFPNGERKEQAFSQRDKLEAIFVFIDSLGLPGIGRNYRLVSSFPRKVYGVDQKKMTLKDAKFDQEATLFIELV